MVSNFKASGTDLDDILAKRNWFNSGNTLWGFGNNQFGSLGIGSTVNRSSPVQIGALTNWKEISSSYATTIGVQENGTIWFWGRDISGNSGIPVGNSASAPTQIGTLSNWSSISISPAHSAAVKTDGTLWTWGDNYHGGLGANNIIPRSSPAQVGSLTSWSKVSAGGYLNYTGDPNGFTMAIRTNGTLWSWGLNSRIIAPIIPIGILGLNNTTLRSSPTQIGSLTDWQNVACGGAHTVAIKTNGTLWIWGAAEFGRLGLNDLIFRSSPTQVGLLTNWNNISTGRLFSLATKIDGTLWAWGQGGAGGKLGLNATINTSSPTQVGSLTNWRTGLANYTHSAAIKSDGTLWTWGSTIDGRLGLGNNISRSSPTQVGTLDSWKSVFGGSISERTFVFKAQGINIY